MKRKSGSFGIAWLALLFLAHASIAQVKPARIFSDHMVLQRGVKVPVWGTATPGKEITVEIDGMRAGAVTDRDGRWRLWLPALRAGGPYEMVISGDGDVKFTDVLIGEVWFASGQSNMGFTMNGGPLNKEKEIAAANYPKIRLFTVPRRVGRTPKQDLESGSWAACTPETVADFSAVAYFFGRKIHKDLNVPVGLINCSWGGTPAEAWTSAEMLKSLPAYRNWVEELEKDPVNWEEDVEANKQRQAKKNDIIRHSFEGLKQGVAKLNYDDSDWKSVAIPNWDKDLDGIVWMRKRINVPKEFKKQPVTIDLGRIQFYAIVYFNGQKIGEVTSPHFARFDVPGDLVRAGDNEITLRVLHFWAKPQFDGPAERMKVTAANGVVIDDLADVWRYKTGLEPEFPEIKNYQGYPASLYNGMVAPVIPYGIAGVIWYQGEANAGKAYDYRSLFKALITDWRIRWEEGYAPFLFVQLANYLDRKPDPGEDSWAELREAQLQALALPKTGMAVTIDIGEALDIHPKNKQEVGRRLALIAEKMAYGLKVVDSGPIFKSMKIDGKDVELNFDHIGSGLMAKGGTLRGFAVAGADKKFYWARARIAGNQVILRSDKVPHPVAVRYGWASNPDCNLYNKEGLPASPFRTDEWPGITQKKKH